MPARAAKVPTQAEKAAWSGYARAAIRRVDIHLARGRVDLALEAALGARQVLDPRALETVASLLRSELRVRVRAKDFDGARDTLAELRKWGDAAELEIEILFAEGNREEALDKLRVLTRGQPDALYLVGRLATENLIDGGPTAALAGLDEAEKRLDAEMDRRLQGGTADEVFEIESSLPGLHATIDRQRAAVHQEAGDAAAAEVAMQAALAHEPTSASSLNDLAYMWAGWGTHLDEAKAMSLRALAQQPFNGGMQDTYGWVLFRLGDLEGARAALELANRYTPSEPENLSHLAAVYARLGMMDRARDRYKEALREVDDSSPLHRRVAEQARAELRALDAPAQTHQREERQQQRR